MPCDTTWMRLSHQDKVLGWGGKAGVSWGEVGESIGLGLH